MVNISRCLTDVKPFGRTLLEDLAIRGLRMSRVKGFDKCFAFGIAIFSSILKNGVDSTTRSTTRNVNKPANSSVVNGQTAVAEVPGMAAPVIDEPLRLVSRRLALMGSGTRPRQPTTHYRWA